MGRKNPITPDQKAPAEGRYSSRLPAHTEKLHRLV